MVKVFLVEDELIIRKSIRENIDWEKEGFQFVGEAGDGEVALPLIRQTKPDILITDVKMPFMDGLQLSALVKNELPDTKIIILSGFRDFEFAKQAISIGVTDYLSKPITSEHLLETIKQVRTKLEQDQELASLRDTYQKQMAERYALERNQFLNNILERQLSTPDLIKEGEKLHLNLVAPYYNIILCKFMSQNDPKEMQKATDEAIAAFRTEKAIEVFERGYDGIALLLLANDIPSIQALEKRVAETMKSIQLAHQSLQYFGGIGRCVQRLSEIPVSYQWANRGFASRFFMDANRLVSGGVAPASPATAVANPSKLNWKHIEEFLVGGTLEEIPGFTEQYIEAIGAEHFNDLSFRSYVATNAYYCTIASAIFSPGQPPATIAAPPLLSSLDEFQNYLSSLLKAAIIERERSSSKKNLQQIEKAKQYILSHVEEYGLSLNSVAEYVGMSPNYFSSVFSHEAGKTFIDFLTEARIKKAKELLMCTSMRPSDIAQEVGYQDAHYFGYLFKKLVGSTPKEYRDRGIS